MCSNCNKQYSPRSPADVFNQLSQISGIQRIGRPYRGSWGSSMAVLDGETRGEDSSVRIQHGAFTSAALTVADNSHVKTHKIPIPVDRVGHGGNGPRNYEEWAGKHYCLRSCCRMSPYCPFLKQRISSSEVILYARM
jgi:hypothetical protein